MIAQVGLAVDLGPLFATVAIIAITIVCLVLDLAALIATQAKNSQTRFAIKAGAFSLATGLICIAWATHVWFPLIFFPALAIIFGALTVAAGFYMRRRISDESRTNE